MKRTSSLAAQAPNMRFKLVVREFYYKSDEMLSYMAGDFFRNILEQKEWQLSPRRKRSEAWRRFVEVPSDIGSKAAGEKKEDVDFTVYVGGGREMDLPWQCDAQKAKNHDLMVAKGHEGWFVKIGSLEGVDCDVLNAKMHWYIWATRASLYERGRRGDPTYRNQAWGRHWI